MNQSHLCFQCQQKEICASTTEWSQLLLCIFKAYVIFFTTGFETCPDTYSICLCFRLLQMLLLLIRDGKLNMCSSRFIKLLHHMQYANTYWVSSINEISQVALCFEFHVSFANVWCCYFGIWNHFCCLWVIIMLWHQGILFLLRACLTSGIDLVCYSANANLRSW